MQTPEFDISRSTVHRREEELVTEDPGTAGRDPQEMASTLGNANVGRVLRAEDGEAELDESVARAIEQRRGAGSALPGQVRENMEGAFGADFSDVRVHDDPDAHELNESVRARAFTVGNDIFFKEGTYDTSSTPGKKLLAHELTHVVQQDGGAEGAPTTVTDPHGGTEQQADTVADHVVSGGRRDASGAPGAMARKGEDVEEEDLAMSRQADELEEDLATSAEVGREGPDEEIEEEV